MKPEEKKIYEDALKDFEALDFETKLTLFIQMENAKVILRAIVNDLKAAGKEAAEKEPYMLLSNVMKWLSVYMKAGLEAGYTARDEEEEDA